MADLFAASPLLLLFVVAAIGYLFGRVPFFSVKLGVAAVLFVGLAFGAYDPRFQLPELFESFGLVIFVYTIGLSCGPGFVAMLRGKGWQQNALVIGMITFAAALTAGLERLLHLGAVAAAGLFSGALSNTPALAAVTELVKGNSTPPASDAAVVAFSISYPVSVVGVLIAFLIAKRLLKNAPQTRGQSSSAGQPQTLVSRTLLVKHPSAAGHPLREVLTSAKLNVIAARVLSHGVLKAALPDQALELGDLLSIVGQEHEVARAAEVFGETSSVHLEEDRSRLDFRRVLVSNPALAGRTLADLALHAKFGAVVTRLRRGDVEMLPRPEHVLDLGDRLRIVAPHEQIAAISLYLGDSERLISEFDVISLGLGIAMGLMVGLIPVPLPGGLTLRLGAAGGPMVVSLILGAYSRTGPILWSLPHGANLTLRQLGLVLFLATVGTRAGMPFAETMSHGSAGWWLFLAGAVVTGATAGLTLWLGHRLLRLPTDLLFGLVGGLQTQPALLAYAQEQKPGDDAGLGYAAVFPLAFILKVLLAQVLVLFLPH